MPWDSGLSPAVLDEANCRSLVNDTLGFDATVALGTASTEAMQLASVLSKVINFGLATHANATGKFQHVDARLEACMHEVHNQQGIMQGIVDGAKAEFVAIQVKFEQDTTIKKARRRLR